MTPGAAAVAPTPSLRQQQQQQLRRRHHHLHQQQQHDHQQQHQQRDRRSTALDVIAAYDAATTRAAAAIYEHAIAAAADAIAMDEDPHAMLVDPELVRDLVESGSAEAIVAEQAAKALLRRRKHRENMIRYRRNKKMSFEDMKAEEQRLAAQLQTMLHEHIYGSGGDGGSNSESVGDRNRLPAASDGAPQEAPAAAAAALMPEARSRGRAVNKFVGALAQKELLHHENVLLRQRLADFHKLRQVVHEAYEQDIEEESARARKEYMQGFEQPGGRWVRFLEHDEPFYFVPFRREECCEIASKTLAQVYAHQSGYLAAGDRSRDATVMKLFDWIASLQFEWDDAVQLTMIRYQFKKTFRNPQRSVQQLVDAEWTIFNDPKHFLNVHRVPVFSQLLQQVDENMSLRIWNAPEPKKSLRFRNVSLFSRSTYTSPDEKDCGIVTVTGVQLKNFREQDLQSLDEFCKKHAAHDDTSEDEDHDGDEGSAVYTHGGFVYTTFAADENGDMEVEFGGRVDITSEEQGRFLMVELGGTCVRLEHLLFPLRVLTRF